MILVVHFVDFVLIDNEFVAIVAVRAVARPEPDVTVRILENIKNGNLRQAIFYSQVGEEEIYAIYRRCI